MMRKFVIIAVLAVLGLSFSLAVSSYTTYQPNVPVVADVGPKGG